MPVNSIIMRKIVMYIPLLVISIVTYAGESKTYMSLDSCGNDTLGYLKENFEDNDFYVGKSINTLLNDIEIPINHCVYMPAFFTDKKIHDVVFFLDDEQKILRSRVKKGDGGKYISIYVVLEVPISEVEYDALEKRYREASKKRNYNLSDKWEEFDRVLFGEKFIKEVRINLSK